MVQVGTPEEIIVNPKTEYVADFVEHADPTGVITAGTVAVPLGSAKLSKQEDGDVDFYAHEGVSDVLYGVDRDNRLERVKMNGQSVQTRRLEEVLDEEPPSVRSHELALVCPHDATLRHILQGRNHSSLPTVVLADNGEVIGLVSERELIQGILDKRGHQDPEEVHAAIGERADTHKVGVRKADVHKEVAR